MSYSGAWSGLFIYLSHIGEGSDGVMKETLRTLPCLAIVLIMMFSVVSLVPDESDSPIPCRSSQVSPSASHWSYYYGFYWDDRTVGTLCDKSPGFGYSWSDGRGNVTVNTTNFDDSVCMKFDKISGSASMDVKYVRDFEGYWRYTFKLASPTGDANLQVWLVNGSTLLLGTGFDAGKIMVWDGASVSYDSYALDIWYEFDVRVSTINDTYQVFVNDTLVEGGVLSPAAGNVSKVTGFWYRLSTATTGVAYSDDPAFWTWAEYDYETDDFLYEMIDALDYVYDTMYRPGAMGELGGTGIITGYEDEVNASYPRQMAASVMDAAVVAYEVTLLAKYWNMATDIGRWLDDVAQRASGYYSNTGGESINGPDNVLTSLGCAGSMIRLYELTHNSSVLDSALEAIDFQIASSWNSTIGLFNDKPGSQWARINLNTAAAKDLAYAYRVTGDASYYQHAKTILDTLPSYMYDGKPGEDPAVNYSGQGYYAKSIAETGFQGWDYESFSAGGYGAAIYHLRESGVSSALIDGWIPYLQKEIFTLTDYGLWYGMAKNISTHNYLESLQAYSVYNLLTDYEIPQFLDRFKSMVEYSTDRATVKLSDDLFIPTNQFWDAPDVVVAQGTSLGQMAGIWIWETQTGFAQPYRLTLNTSMRIIVAPDAAGIEIHDLAQIGGEVSWTAAGGDAAVYSVVHSDGTIGYKVYRDGNEIWRQRAGTSGIIFTAAGDGDFEITIWDPYAIWSGVSGVMFMVAVALGVCGIFIALLKRGGGRG